MRQLMVTAISAALIAVTPPAEAHHRPNTYCSETGDICQSTRKVDGPRKATILMAARYFRRYEFCLRSPLGFWACKDFRIEDLGHGIYGDRVKLRRHFNVSREGRYKVAWYRKPKQGPATKLIGKKLGFHAERK